MLVKRNCIDNSKENLYFVQHQDGRSITVSIQGNFTCEIVLTNINPIYRSFLELNKSTSRVTKHTHSCQVLVDYSLSLNSTTFLTPKYSFSISLSSFVEVCSFM